jgi:hypothetical protein
MPISMGCDAAAQRTLQLADETIRRNWQVVQRRHAFEDPAGEVVFRAVAWQPSGQDTQAIYSKGRPLRSGMSANVATMSTI